MARRSVIRAIRRIKDKKITLVLIIFRLHLWIGSLIEKLYQLAKVKPKKFSGGDIPKLIGINSKTDIIGN